MSLKMETVCLSDTFISASSPHDFTAPKTYIAMRTSDLVNKTRKFQIPHTNCTCLIPVQSGSSHRVRQNDRRILDRNSVYKHIEYNYLKDRMYLQTGTVHLGVLRIIVWFPGRSHYN